MQRSAVKMAMDPELEGLTNPHKDSRSMGEHHLKGFFIIRRISQRKLAKIVGEPEPSLSLMFNGVMYLPVEVEQKLNDLKDKIEAYEKKTGKLFNS